MVQAWCTLFLFWLTSKKRDSSATQSELHGALSIVIIKSMAVMYSRLNKKDHRIQGFFDTLSANNYHQSHQLLEICVRPFFLLSYVEQV